MYALSKLDKLKGFAIDVFEIEIFLYIDYNCWQYQQGIIAMSLNLHLIGSAFGI